MIRGFVDIHMHGCAGFDAGTCATIGFHEMARKLASHGTAAFLPTIPAASFAQTRSALSRICTAMDEQRPMLEKARNGELSELPEAVILGAHLEGPFLCPAYKGALDEDSFVAATRENWEALTGAYASIVRRITIDPLADHAPELISYLAEQGISVSVGHTAASCPVVQDAFERGATSVTHIFNAMPSLHHREPGPIGAALASDTVYAELILDFLHVKPEAAKLVMKAKGTDLVAVITDSCEAAGMPDGAYTLCGRAIRVINGEARMPDGRLASSTVFMDREYAHILQLGFTERDAAKMLHEVPLRAARIPEETKALIDCLYAKQNADGAICGIVYQAG